MPTIDDKVVAMSFENSKFESGVKTTMGSLDKLKKSLQFNEAGKGLNTLGTNINGLNSQFRPLNKSVDSVRAHFSALNVAASAVIGHIAIQLTNIAERAIKAFTIGPIIQGLDIYNTKLQAIQTILANTQAAGTKMSDVTAALNQLNIYANKTIYSFGQMTKNIGTFTAAGVGLKPAVSAIKGIANLAALSGSNADQASTAMYQLSQAISAGRVSLQDWNSVVNAGMGGTVFQRALATTAVAMGKLKDSSVKLVGPMKNVKVAGESFRQSIQAGPGKQSWLTSDVLTKTLSTFTGDMTDAQLAASGFNKQQIKDIQATAKTALQAATQVKSFSQLMDITKETIATGWSQSFEIIIGNLTEAKKLFTDISNTLNNVINKSAATRNKILGDWKALGGRTKLIAALKETFQALGDVLRPIRDAFRDIFPRRTGRDLFNLTVEFKKFADTLKPTQTTIDNLRRTFRGVFAILDIGKQIIGGIIGVFAKLFGVVFSGSGSFLAVTANIGDFLVSVDKALKKGKGLETFFNGLARVLAVPLHLFAQIGHAVATMFDGFSPGPFSVNMDIATKASEPFKRVLEVIINALQGLGPAISNAVQHMNFELILSVIRTGLLAGIVLMIRKFIGGTNLERVLGLFGSKLGSGFAKNLGGGILGNLSKSFGSLTGSLKAMQQNLQAKTLEAIAISIALLTASVVALSFVKPKRLNAALTAIAIGFGELIGVMVVMNKLIDTKATLKLPVIAASLVVMATAIDILAIAVFALGKLKGDELAKGLGAIAILLGTLSVATQFLSKNAVGMVVASAAMTGIAIALNIMALAVKQFGSMDLQTLAKGLGAVAGTLVAIAIGMRLMPNNIIFTAGGVVIVAFALNILAKAVAKFGAMNLQTIGKGLLGIGGGLVIIAGAMQLMPKNMIFTATGLFIVATALGKIVSAVGLMGGMPIKKLATGLASLAIALGILALALTAMSGSLAGAAALALAAAGIALFVPALVSLGKQSWTSIIKSLVALAAGFALIAASGLLLAPSIPALIGFGAALVLIGAGLALAGAGVALIGIGLSAIAVAGPTAVAILIQALINLSKSIGEIGKNTVLGLLEIVKAFAKVAPQFVKAAVKIIDTLTEAILKSSPKIAEALVVILVAGLQAIDKHANEIIAAGFSILEKLLQGISDNIGQVVTMAVTIIVTLVESLAKNANRLVSAGFNLIISIYTGITNNIGKLISAGVRIVTNLLTGIANNIKKVITAGANIITHLLTGISNNIGRVVVAGGKAIAHFITGLGTAGQLIIDAGTRTIIKLINAIQANDNRLVNAGFRAIIRFLNGIADSIDKHEPELIHAGFRIGQAIVTGMIKGLASLAPDLVNKAKDLAGSALHKIGHVFHLGSPSRETYKIGRFVVQGLINGIDDTAPKAQSAVQRLSTSLLDTMNNVSFDDLLHTEPTITPVLDLTGVQNGSKKLQGIIDKSPLGSVSLSHAAVISTRQAAASAEDMSAAGGQSIKFEQNNFSPKALTATEVYRQTRNQLSQLKSKAHIS
jgi:tape measure domain-containing protein